MAHHATFTMAALLGVGGVMGYVKTRSVPSLVAGITLGAGFGIAGYMLQNGQMTEGHGVGLFFSSITMSAMGIRAMKSRKTLPIAISSIGALSSAYHAHHFTQWVGQE